MMVLLNKTAVNLNNVCTMERYYKIGVPNTTEVKLKPRIFIKFTNGQSEEIQYDDAELMDKQFNYIIDNL